MKTFDADYLKDELDLPYACEDRVFIEEHRWYNLFLGIFEHEGVKYGVEFADPATELQEDLDPFLDARTVDAHKVQQVPVTKMVWQIKGD